MNINELASQVNAAALKLAATSSDLRNSALKQIASALLERKDEILEANHAGPGSQRKGKYCSSPFKKT